MNHAPRLFRWLGAALLLGQLNCPVFALFPKCGDGILDTAIDEKCDDGNRDSGDGCSASCEIERCGDGEINNAPGGEETETCDDGGNVNNDGCSSACEIENCGDGFQSANEECDDGGNAPGDGCDAQCLFEVLADCQDNKLSPNEECDDGNNTNNDGCQRNCTLTPCGSPAEAGSFQFGSVCYDAIVVNASTIASSFFAVGNFQNQNAPQELAILIGDDVEFFIFSGTAAVKFESTDAPDRAVSFMNSLNLDGGTDDLAFSFNDQATPGLEVRLNAAEDDPTSLVVNPNKTSRSFVSGDANGDGNNDIISVVEFQDVGIQRYIRQGEDSLNEDGGFFSGGTKPAFAALAQLDGVGGPDYLLLSEGAAPGTGQIAFTPLDNSGNAAASTSFIVNGVNGFIFAVAGNLIPNNGTDEVAVLNNLDESVSIISKGGPNLLQNTNQVRLTGKPRSADFLDVNRDGLLDLVVLGENFLAILPSNGQGTLQAPLHISLPVGTTPIGFSVERVDPSNNLPDITIVLSGADGTNLLVFRSR